MDNNNRKLELQVGLFVLFGLIAAGFLIVSFGRFGELFQDSYEITAKFTNTSGVIKGSQVLYRGARVGTVATSPEIVESGKFVVIGLKINQEIRIDTESTFRVGSYGLLGDRFIDVQPPSTPSGSYLSQGDEVAGHESTGISDITEKLAPVAEQLQKFALGLEEQEVVANLGASMESIKGITAKLDRILAEAESGQGTVHTLLNDEKTAEDIKATIADFKQLSENLRRRGILFYKDLSEEEAQKTESSSKGSSHPQIERARNR